MESNKDEARRVMDIAEMKLSVNDYVGAKKFVNKACDLYPNLDGLKQVLLMIDVFISASKNGKGEEADWYGVLGVDPLADDEALKKQYKKLALLLHPDKNNCERAEEAFKLVSEAWCLLSDKSKRIAYDQKRKLKQVYFTKRSGMQHNQPNPQEPNIWSTSQPDSSNKPKSEPKPNYHDCSSRKAKDIDFVQAYFAKKHGL